MTEWEEFLSELKSQADAMVKTSPVKIEIKPIGENELILHNTYNHMRVRLDYVPAARMFYLEPPGGKRQPVKLAQPWEELAIRVLMTITG
jgi:hypothetical protein